MDLGTANTIIISDDKIVVDEPSVVALDRRMFATRAFGVSSHYDTAINAWFVKTAK